MTLKGFFVLIIFTHLNSAQGPSFIVCHNGREMKSKGVRDYFKGNSIENYVYVKIIFAY